jgi:hypothetical protein
MITLYLLKVLVPEYDYTYCIFTLLVIIRLVKEPRKNPSNTWGVTQRSATFGALPLIFLIL